MCRLTGFGGLSGNLSFDRLRTNGFVWELGIVRELSPNPPKSRGISAGAWVKDAARWRCGYDADAGAF